MGTSLCTQFSASVHSTLTPRQMTNHRIRWARWSKVISRQERNDKLFTKILHITWAVKWLFSQYPLSRSPISVGGIAIDYAIMYHQVYLQHKELRKAGST